MRKKNFFGEMQRKVKFLAKGTKVSSHIKEFFQSVLILLCRPKVQSLEAMPPDSQSKALPSVERQTQGPQGGRMRQLLVV